MKIYLIYGEKDAGKTTTCNKLLKCILSLGGTLKSYDTFDWAEDFKSVAEFEGKRIGIYSPGDERGHLSGAITLGVDNNCDILVATVRKGIAYNAPLQKMGEENPEKWITLVKGGTEAERDNYENRVVIGLLDNIQQS
ncbi:hypothetical protein [Muribaculum intestinale]|uniref:hypothetical protein n=1 Tax=Muribaculum intestinale TaxID=1796646 RepID=UPI00263209A7|nr:hypothetical protein [Muribaculum intestinale]